LKARNKNRKGKKANSFFTGTPAAQISLFLVSSSSSSSIPSTHKAQKLFQQTG